MLHIKLEKATPGRSPRKRRTLLQQLQGRVYRLPAHLTSEDDWQRDVPNVKLSRAFAVVLGIHVVAIGGFMAFELFRHKDADAEAAATAATVRPSATTPAAREPLSSAARTPVASTTRGAEPALNDPANDGLRTYVVGPGESLGAIAAKFDVDEHLLAQKNGIGRERPFETGMKLVIPNQQITARRPEDLERLLDQNEKANQAPENPIPVARAEPAEKPATSPPVQRATVPATSKSSPATATADEKPVRRAEPVAESTRIKPNKDPKRASGQPARLAASQASRLSSASAGTAVKRTTGAGGDRPAAASKPRGSRTHVVVEGDTAFRIARTYKVGVDDLIKANGFKPEKLRPGMRLVIPASSN